MLPFLKLKVQISIYFVQTLLFLIINAICICKLTVISILGGETWQQCPIFNRLVSRKTGTLAILNWERFSKWTQKSFHYTCHRPVVIVLPGLFVPFLFHPQAVDLPLCCSVKTRCMAEAFIQVRVSLQVFHPNMPDCRLSRRNKLSCTVAAGFEGTFSICPRMQPSQFMSLCPVGYSCTATRCFKVVWVTRQSALTDSLALCWTLAVSDLATTYSLVSKWPAERACCFCNFSPDTR